MNPAKHILALLVAAWAGLAPSRAWATEEPEPAGEQPRWLHLNGYFQHALRIHSKITRVQDGGEHRSAGSWVTGANLTSVSRSERVTQVTTAGGELGGGGAGLDGQLGISLAHGWTLLPGEHTPFFRGAGLMKVQANREYYFSAFQFPGIELGYQYAQPEWLFELGGDAGLAVDGRYRVRHLITEIRGVPLYGGHLLLSFRRPSAKLLLLGRLVRLADDQPIDTLDLRLCTAALGLVHACTTIDYFTQTWAGSDGSDWVRRVLVTGISVGLGLPLHRETPAGRE